MIGTESSVIGQGAISNGIGGKGSNKMLPFGFIMFHLWFLSLL